MLGQKSCAGQKWEFEFPGEATEGIERAMDHHPASEAHPIAGHRATASWDRRPKRHVALAGLKFISDSSSAFRTLFPEDRSDAEC